MLEGGSQSYDDVTSTHQADDDAGQVDDWELVIREAHHRMKNTLMLLVASVRTDFRCGRSSQLSAAVDRFERRVVAFGELYQLLSNGADIEAVSVADFFERLCEALVGDNSGACSNSLCSVHRGRHTVCDAMSSAWPDRDRTGHQFGKACVLRQECRTRPHRSIQPQSVLVLLGNGQRHRCSRFTWNGWSNP